MQNPYCRRGLQSCLALATAGYAASRPAADAAFVIGLTCFNDGCCHTSKHFAHVLTNLDCKPYMLYICWLANQQACTSSAAFSFRIVVCICNHEQTARRLLSTLSSYPACGQNPGLAKIQGICWSPSFLTAAIMHFLPFRIKHDRQQLEPNQLMFTVKQPLYALSHSHALYIGSSIVYSTSFT